MRLNLPILILSAALGLAGWRGMNALLDPGPDRPRAAAAGETAAPAKVRKPDREWRAALSPEQYEVMRQCGTEPAFSGAYNDFFEEGAYACAACGTVLFGSETKYDHGTGWPSFWAARDNANLEFRDDYSFLMRRTEVRCAACGAHLGHVFEDGPPPTGEHYCINSVALTFRPAGADAARTAEPRTATFAAGCFWGVEYKFGELEGVLDTEAGYSGGTKPNPTYREVCSDSTGHAESVRITYDPSVVTYEQLVRFFFTIHDPTQVDRQGPDVGSQYRSVIFTHDDTQAAAARAVIAELTASGRFSKPIATRVVPAPEFFRAEEYHQRYYEKKVRG